MVCERVWQSYCYFSGSFGLQDGVPLILVQADWGPFSGFQGVLGAEDQVWSP
jgi:hypothetical protein